MMRFPVVLLNAAAFVLLNTAMQCSSWPLPLRVVAILYHCSYCLVHCTDKASLKNRVCFTLLVTAYCDPVMVHLLLMEMQL